MSFPTTQWSLMAIASMNGDRAGREALEELCRRYRQPVFAYFKSRLPVWEDAEDMTQILFVQLVRKGIWRRAEAGKGRFRTYLTGVARHALSNWRRSSRCTRRGAGVSLESLDLLSNYDPAMAVPESSDRAFNLAWACAATASALRRLEARAAAVPGDAARFAVLRRFLPGAAAPPSSAEAAAQLGVTEDNLRTLLHRLRGSFREALRAEVAQTLGLEEDLDEEMIFLGRVLAGSDGI